MSDQDEKRIIVKVAYNYFQDKKWDQALEEYKKMTIIDPMDFLVHNMMAEIYVRKGEPEKAVDEYTKAANLLGATNNIEKAIHTYKQIIKIDSTQKSAELKIDELVTSRMDAIDTMVKNGELVKARDCCERLSFKVPEKAEIDDKLAAIEKMIEEKAEESTIKAASEANDEKIQNDELVNNLVTMAEKYEQKKAWDEAIEIYITILRFQPDEQIKNKLKELYQKISTKDQSQKEIDHVATKQKEKIKEEINVHKNNQVENKAEVQLISNTVSESKELPRADFSVAYSEMEKLRLRAEEKLHKAVEDRKAREQEYQSNVGTTSNESIPQGSKNIDEQQAEDIQVLLTQAQMYIRQNMLAESMRLCQRILEIDSQNKEVRGLLKKIYDKKKL